MMKPHITEKSDVIRGSDITKKPETIKKPDITNKSDIVLGPHISMDQIKPPDLTGLNEAQRKAVTHGEGPLLLLAGPGSGKTFTITNRILYLLKNGAAPERILVITFTKEAAFSMQRRFQEMCGHLVYPVNFGTFHSCFYHILQKSGAVGAKKIIKNSEKITLLLSVLKQFENNMEKGAGDNLKDDAAQLLSAASFYKNTLNREAALKKIPSIWQPHFEAVMTAYEGRVKKEGYIDFDDMLSECRRLLQENAEIRSYWQERFSHILIDEFQDINPVQYGTVKLLTRAPHNIFAVGDDDQAIYGFRGAEPDCLRRFAEEFRARKLLLDVNYRSRKEIVQASLAVIGENKNRFEKKLRAAQEVGSQFRKEGGQFQESGNRFRREESQFRKDRGQFQEVGSQFRKDRGQFQEVGSQFRKDRGQFQEVGNQFQEVENPFQEVENPFQEVGNRFQEVESQSQKVGSWAHEGVICQGFAGREDQYRYMLDVLGCASAERENCAILFRTNSYMQGFAARLGREGIPYEIRETAVSIYEHFIVKDIAAYLSVAGGSGGREDFLRIVNKPSRYVSREAVAECGVDIAKLKAYYERGNSLSSERRAAVVNGLTILERQLKNMGRLSLHLAVDFCLKAAGYERYLREKAAAGEDKWQEWQEMLEWLRGDAAQYPNLKEWLSAQEAYNRALAQGMASGKQIVRKVDNVRATGNIGKADNARAEKNAGKTDSTGKAGIAEKNNPVQLMTVHAAKGLEFDRVWIPDCNEKVYPHGSLPDTAAVEEERRIFYVAMTRAKKSLELLYLTGTKERPRQPSRFLNPLFAGGQCRPF